MARKIITAEDVAERIALLGRATFPQLATEFAVCDSTVRRRCDEAARAGLVVVVQPGCKGRHGGLRVYAPTKGLES